MDAPFSKKMCCYCLKRLEENRTTVSQSNRDIEHIALGLVSLARQEVYPQNTNGQPPFPQRGRCNLMSPWTVQIAVKLICSMLLSLSHKLVAHFY